MLDGAAMNTPRSSNESRRHHFLPKCYLKGFARPRKRNRAYYVEVFDRGGRQFNSNIENVAVVHDFNRLDSHSDPTVFENSLSRFESDLAPALERLIKSATFPKGDDRELILSLIVQCAIHIPRMREITTRMYADVFKLTAEVMTANQDRWDAVTRQVEVKDGLSEEERPTLEEARKLIDEGAVGADVANETHIGHAVSAFPKLLEIMRLRNWSVLSVQEDIGDFVTSDNPVYLNFSEPSTAGNIYGPGFGITRTDVLFPISRGIALWGNFEKPEKHYAIDQRQLAQINGSIISYAVQHIFARDRSFPFMMSSKGKMQFGDHLMMDPAFVKRA